MCVQVRILGEEASRPECPQAPFRQAYTAAWLSYSCRFHEQVNQDPKPFGAKTPDCSEDPTAVQTVLERSGELSWNIDRLPGDCVDPTDTQVPITSFVHEVLPQVRGRCIAVVYTYWLPRVKSCILDVRCLP